LTSTRYPVALLSVPVSSEPVWELKSLAVEQLEWEQ